jgi:glucose/arabinose dehydrogenase
MEEATDETGRFFVAEQDGRIMMIRKGAPEAAEMLNIEDRKPHASLEEGLLGFAFHPQFKSNQLFYICYTQTDPRRTVISEFKMSADNSDRADMKSERVVLEVPQPFENHKAGQVSFGPDGFLYIGLGDGGRGNDPLNNSQNTAVLPLLKFFPRPVGGAPVWHSRG